MNSIGQADITAEQSVLGAALLDANVMDELLHLEERDFSIRKHQDLFKVLRFLERKNIPIDIVSVTETYVKFGRIEEIGGVDYLSKLAESCPSTSNVKYLSLIHI